MAKEVKVAEDVYTRLREFVDRLPGGLPESGSGVEIKLLQKFFTPEEAEFFMQLNQYPEPATAIAARAGMDEQKAAEMLESMASKGCIFRLRINGQPYYMAMSFVVGMYEFHLKSMDRELAELMEEYFPYLTDSASRIAAKQMRVVPVGEAVDIVQEVGTYDRIREMVKSYDEIAVADCICRVEKGVLGQECERPMETCLVFGVAAQYYIENGLGRKIDIEECQKILDRAEESALVLCPSNAQEFAHICCCCSCCCGMLAGLRRLERPADHALSSFQASIDPDLCVACGTCLDRCQIEAIVEGDDFMEVDLTRCIGCGLCVSTCPEDAASLVPKPSSEAPPANVMEMTLRISRERGLA
jgi:electron transport complex protein RnfB